MDNRKKLQYLKDWGYKSAYPPSERNRAVLDAMRAPECGWPEANQGENLYYL